MKLFKQKSITVIKYIHHGNKYQLMNLLNENH